MYVRKRLIPFLLITAPIVILVLAGKDLATAGVIGVVAFSVFFFADNSKVHNLFLGVVPALGAILAFVAVSLESFRQSRLATYFAFLKDGEIINPLSTGYQLSQIMVAVGSGGLTGYGFGQSKQKYFYLQETAFSDTIFAVAAEEFGLLGGVILVAVLILFVSRGFKIARKLDSKFEALLCLGIVIWISIQSFVHLGVNVGLLPLTGIPLPLVSYGGSSMLSVLVSIGLLLNISRKVKLD
jgi:cell division protein FtsW